MDFFIYLVRKEDHGRRLGSRREGSSRRGIQAECEPCSGCTCSVAMTSASVRELDRRNPVLRDTSQSLRGWSSLLQWCLVWRAVHR